MTLMSPDLPRSLSSMTRSKSFLASFGFFFSAASVTSSPVVALSNSAEYRIGSSCALRLTQEPWHTPPLPRQTAVWPGWHWVTPPGGLGLHVPLTSPSGACGGNVTHSISRLAANNFITLLPLLRHRVVHASALDPLPEIFEKLLDVLSLVVARLDHGPPHALGAVLVEVDRDILRRRHRAHQTL